MSNRTYLILYLLIASLYVWLRRIQLGLHPLADNVLHLVFRNIETHYKQGYKNTSVERGQNRTEYYSNHVFSLASFEKNCRKFKKIENIK